MSNTDGEKEKKIQDLMSMSTTLYKMHTDLGKLEAPTTGIRQDILKVCSGLDQLRTQIIGGVDKPNTIE